MELRFVVNWVNFTPAAVIMRLEAMVEAESAYLSDRYKTSFTPLWMMARGGPNGVQLRVDDVGVFGLLSFPVPGEFIIRTALGHTVVARGNDDVVLGHDAGAHLGVWVLAPPGRQHGDTHEILVPTDIILSFHGNSPFLFVS